MAAEITHYQSIIGSLLYLMIRTHPDIAFTVTVTNTMIHYFSLVM